MAANSADTTDLVAEKQIPKCSGCKLPHSLQILGDPGPYCTGTTGLPTIVTNLSTVSKPETELSTKPNWKKWKT